MPQMATLVRTSPAQNTLEPQMATEPIWCAAVSAETVPLAADSLGVAVVSAVTVSPLAILQNISTYNFFVYLHDYIARYVLIQ